MIKDMFSQNCKERVVKKFNGKNVGVKFYIKVKI